MFAGRGSFALAGKVLLLVWAGQPFLISLHFNAPHWPWEGPGDEAETERLQRERMGLVDFDGGPQKAYQRMIEDMDRQIGLVLKALDQNGLTENTIVIFTSDNGGERFADTWPFTGKKILDNTFLFDVGDDPLERANLKERRPDVYDPLEREWYAWNSLMLPEIRDSYTDSFDGEGLADHFGAQPPDQKPDHPKGPKK